MINTEDYRQDYTGDDLATEFAYGVPITDKTHLLLTHIDALLVETELVVDVDYSVGGVSDENSANWIITYPLTGSPLPAGERLVIIPNLPAKQETDFENQGGFFAQTHEQAFDYLTILVQQLKEAVARCIKLSVGSTEDADTILANLDANVAAAQAAQAAAELAAGLAEAAAALSPAMPLWVTATPYSVGAVIRYTDEKIYRCATAHTSGTFATDLAAVKWVELSPAAAASGSITASGYTQSTAKMLGRSTASTGAIEEITVGTGLSLSGGTLSATATGEKVAQRVSDFTTSVSSTGTAIPYDATIPQITEGAQFATATITPTNASSKLRVLVQFNGTGTSSVATCVALFKDGAANAVASGSTGVSSGTSDTQGTVTFVYEVTAGSTSATTFTARYGSNSGTAYLNQDASSAKYGGTFISGIEVMEILP